MTSRYCVNHDGEAINGFTLLEFLIASLLLLIITLGAFGILSRARCGAIATLTLGRVLPQTPAWQRLYSMPGDYEHSFLRSVTQVAKVLPPVTYRWGRAGAQLLRREGNRESKVVEGVTDFVVSERVQQDVTSYEAKCGLQREGFAAAAAGGDAAGHTTTTCGTNSDWSR
ncbi:MAG: prepilin-type N-terminal cleavage/methylation domain-containing protein [Pyrinomonadaceae bacterium]